MRCVHQVTERLASYSKQETSLNDSGYQLKLVHSEILDYRDSPENQTENSQFKIRTNERSRA